MVLFGIKLATINNESKEGIYMKKLAGIMLNLSKAQFVLLGVQTLVFGVMLIGHYTGKLK